MKKYFLSGFLTSLFLFILASGIFAATVDEVKQNIIRQANELGVEPAIVLSLAKVESSFNQSAKGPGGHIGVFQLSPATAQLMGLDAYDLDDNVKGGIIYYKRMYDKFGSPELAAAAYNLGERAVRIHHNTVPPRTKKFVDMVMANYKIYKNAGY